MNCSRFLKNSLQFYDRYPNADKIFGELITIFKYIYGLIAQEVSEISSMTVQPRSQISKRCIKQKVEQLFIL